MKLNYKAILILAFCLFSYNFSQAKLNENEESLHGMKGYEYQPIDASKNARTHNNIGNIYFDEKNYIAALKEYEVAYNLAPKSAFGAIYLYNISRCYIQLGNYKLAQNAIEGAINKDCMNMTYYETLVDCYIKRGTYAKELSKHLHDTENPYNRIIAGLIFLKTGRTSSARVIFDEFINKYPRMLITQDVIMYLNRLN